MILGARALGEFGDDPNRFTDAKSRKNYASTSPITRASGKHRVVLARYARNRRLAATGWEFGLVGHERLGSEHQPVIDAAFCTAPRQRRPRPHPPDGRSQLGSAQSMPPAPRRARRSRCGSSPRSPARGRATGALVPHLIVVATAADPCGFATGEAPKRVTCTGTAWVSPCRSHLMPARCSPGAPRPLRPARSGPRLSPRPGWFRVWTCQRRHRAGRRPPRCCRRRGCGWRSPAAG